MNAEPPLWAPCEEYDAASDVNADGTSHLDDMYSHLDCFFTSIAGLENISPSTLQ